MKKTLVFVLTLAVVAAPLLAAEYTEVPVEDVPGSYTAPELVASVLPVRVFYTPSREVEGYVTLAILVNEEGKVEKAKVTYRTSRLAVNNAVDAVSRWEFKPATLNGTAVKTWVAYNLPFGTNLEIFEETEFAGKVLLDNDILTLLK